MSPSQDQLQIKPYTDVYRQSIIAVWEASVLATHDFLSPADFQEIKTIVRSLDFTALQVYCLVEESKVLGFVGVADKKVEMLFLHPSCFGTGKGKQLLQFAIHGLGADQLDVNAQNKSACAFYEKQGFKVYERTDFDDQGRPYPLLRMRLRQLR